MTKEESIIYLAGYMDADGCFSICITKPQPLPVINATGVDYDFMSRIAVLMADICGIDAISLRVASRPENSNSKDICRINITRNDAVIVLCSELIPYLILKKERAAILMALCEHKKACVPQSRDRRYMKSLSDRLCALNKTGRK